MSNMLKIDKTSKDLNGPQHGLIHPYTFLFWNLKPLSCLLLAPAPSIMLKLAWYSQYQVKTIYLNGGKLGCFDFCTADGLKGKNLVGELQPLSNSSTLTIQNCCFSCLNNVGYKPGIVIPAHILNNNCSIPNIKIVTSFSLSILYNINMHFISKTIILVLSWAAHDTAEVEDDSSHSFVGILSMYHYVNHISTKKFCQNFVCLSIHNHSIFKSWPQYVVS